MQINASGSSSRPLQVIPAKSSLEPQDDYSLPTQKGTINVKYTGAYKGMYNFTMSGIHGAMLANSVSLCVDWIVITGFSPESGSVYGGTLLTVYGNQFMEQEGYSVIKLGKPSDSPADRYCYIEEVWRGEETTDSVSGIRYSSYVKCRVGTDYSRRPHSAQVLAYTSTFDEGSYAPELQNYNFTFLATDQIPTVTSVSTLFTGLEWELNLAGHSITDTFPDAVEVFVGGSQQTVRAVGPASLLVRIDHLDEGLSD